MELPSPPELDDRFAEKLIHDAFMRPGSACRDKNLATWACSENIINMKKSLN
jgi:hypothetical protein